jgi:desulfoferrodoxin (superoxide reductase-like protein)
MKNKTYSASMMIIALFLLFWDVLGYPLNSYATPPQDVKVSYDSNSHSLKVTITHKTLSQNFHYIKYVTIMKNGTIISNNKYGNQPNPEMFTYTYNLPAVEGDLLEVTATCNIFGSKKTTLALAKKQG